MTLLDARRNVNYSRVLLYSYSILVKSLLPFPTFELASITGVQQVHVTYIQLACLDLSCDLERREKKFLARAWSRACE